MTVTADVFPSKEALKNMVRCFKGSLEREHCKWVDTLLQSEWQHIYNIY